MEYKTGDIIVVYTPLKWYNPMTWLAWAIRKIAKIKYNHATMVVLNWDVPFVVEAVARGVIPSPLKDRLKKNKNILLLRRKDMPFKESDLARKINSKVGITGYDFSGLLIYQLIYQLFHVWLGKKGKRAENKMYCYEYCAWVYDDLFPEWWQIDPKKLLKNEHFEHFHIQKIC